MAIAFVAGRGGANSKSTGTTVSVNPSGTIPVGAVVIVAASWDNIATATGLTTDGTITDNQGNVYTRLREHSRSGGAAGDGVAGGHFISKITASITTTDLVTLTLSTAVDAKSLSLSEYSVAAGKTLQVAGAIQAGVVTAGAAGPSLVISGLPSKEYLFLALNAIELPTTETYTEDSDYSASSNRGTSGSTANTNVWHHSSRNITTGTAAPTHNPSWVTSGDAIGILIALEEIGTIPIAGARIVQAPTTRGGTVRGTGAAHILAKRILQSPIIRGGVIALRGIQGKRLVQTPTLRGGTVVATGHATILGKRYAATVVVRGGAVAFAAPPPSGGPLLTSTSLMTSPTLLTGDSPPGTQFINAKLLQITPTVRIHTIKGNRVIFGARIVTFPNVRGGKARNVVLLNIDSGRIVRTPVVRGGLVRPTGRITILAKRLQMAPVVRAGRIRGVGVRNINAKRLVIVPVVTAGVFSVGLPQPTGYFVVVPCYTGSAIVSLYSGRAEVEVS